MSSKLVWLVFALLLSSSLGSQKRNKDSQTGERDESKCGNACRCRGNQWIGCVENAVPMGTPEICKYCEGEEFAIDMLSQISMQKRVMAKMQESMQQINGAIEELGQIIPNRPHEETANPAIGRIRTSKEELLQHIRPNVDFKYRLQLVSEVQLPVFRERAFGIEVQIVDTEGQSAKLEEPVYFKIELYTKDVPPQQLVLNTSQQHLMRGTIAVHGSVGDSTLKFTNIVINEVSSHQRHRCFFFVVMPNEKTIKPLIVDNFVVQARRTKAREPKCCKKRKIEE